MIFTHSGNSGDIIFSIPTINHLCNGEKKAIVYVKALKYASPYGNQYEFVKDLLLQQDCIKEVRSYTPPDDNWNYFHWPGVSPDYDLDTARHQRQRGIIHIIKRYFDQFGIDKDHTVPFLKIDDFYRLNGSFALIHLTPRWNGLQYDWKKIYDEALRRHGKVYFIGFQSEWLDFIIRFNQIEHLQTENLIEMARLIRDCEALYSNQGVALTIAQGLGKEYYLVRNANKTNCFLYTKNEHLYGREMLAHGNTIVNMVPDSHIVR